MMTLSEATAVVVLLARLSPTIEASIHSRSDSTFVVTIDGRVGALTTAGEALMYIHQQAAARRGK